MEPEPDGSWIALKFDRETDMFSIAADSCLLQRWYYCQRGDIWFASNSLLYLKELLGCDAKVNESAIPYMLYREYLPGKTTPLRDVFGLRGREVLLLNGGHPEFMFRKPPSYLSRSTRDPLAAGQIGTSLKDAVAKELSGLSEICVPLSGGMDSRFLLGCAMDVFEAKNITTLTFGRENSLDFKIGTGLARAMGLPNLRLPYDYREIAEQLKDTFPIGEGMFNAVPYHPVESFRSAIAGLPMMLSGYIGDLVFGSYDLSPDEAESLNRDPRILLQRIHRIADLVPPSEIGELMANGDSDPLLTEQSFPRIEADSNENRFAQWLWEDHLLNRTNFAVELYRDKTLYLAPYIHGQVMETAYRLPYELRRKEKAFFDALRKNYPKLWAYPTKRNHGFSLAEQKSFSIFAARAFRKAMSELDSKLGNRTGKIYYHHPRNNYSHPREILQSRHRRSVTEALLRLKERKPFNEANMAALINNSGKAHPRLIQGLLTVDLWYQHYED
jgi:asparagine synthetase B (glutamine-hydrolysing)